VFDKVSRSFFEVSVSGIFTENYLISEIVMFGY
jgi:hypothetical protein